MGGLCCSSGVLAWRGASRGGSQGNPSPFCRAAGAGESSACGDIAGLSKKCWVGPAAVHTSGARAAHLGLGQHHGPSHLGWDSTASVHIWSKALASGSGVALWVCTSGAGTASRASTSGPRQHIWSEGSNVGVPIWRQGSTCGAGTAHLGPAQCTWVWCSVPPDMVHCGGSPAPSQPRHLPGMGVAAPLSCWFPYFPVWFVHIHHQPFLLPVKLVSSYLFLSGHGKLWLSAPRQPALGQEGSSMSAHAWLFPMACSSLCSQNPVASAFLRGRLHCLGFPNPILPVAPFRALCDLLRSSLQPDVQR